MKFRCTREGLLGAVAMVSRAVSSRAILPVLGNVLVEAKGSEVHLAGTNLSISIDCRIAAHVEQDGAITLPARTLGDVLRRLSDGMVTVETSERTVSAQICSGNAKARLSGIDAANFPKTQALDMAKSVAFDATVLAEMIGQVAFAALRDTSRPIIQCVNLTFGKGAFTMVATDGFRLGLRRVPLAHDLGETMLMVHFAGMGELGHLLAAADAEQPVIAGVDDRHNRIAFEMRGKGGAWRAVLSAQLTDGRYPEYTAIIPKNHKTTIGVQAGALLRAVELARLFPRDDGGSSARLSADPVANQLRVSAGKSQRGDGSDAIDAEVKGDAVEISIDADFLIEILSTMRDAQVVIEASLPTRPILIRPFSAGPDEFAHVIMPMRMEKGVR